MEIKIKKIKPLFSGILTTAHKYTEEDNISDGGIIEATKTGMLKENQTVMAIGNMVRNVAVGDLVQVNPKRYESKKYGAGSIKEDMVEHHKLQKEYNFPLVEVDDEMFLCIEENDIDFIITEYEEIKPAEKKTILTEKDTTSPLIIK